MLCSFPVTLNFDILLIELDLGYWGMGYMFMTRFSDLSHLVLRVEIVSVFLERAAVLLGAVVLV